MTMRISTRTLLEHFNWELFDHPSYSLHLAPNNYYLFIYPRYWLRSQPFNNNETLMEGVKAWLSSQASDFFDTCTQNVYPDTTSASFPAVTTLRSSSSTQYVRIFRIQ
jgi:hypothetical protein